MDSKVPVPPGYEPSEGESVPKVETVVADAPEVEVVDEEPKGLFQRAWAALKAAATTTWNGVTTVARYVVDSTAWVYYVTLAPVVDYIEVWIPGCSQLRDAMFWYAVGTLVVGAVIGGLVFAEAGYMLPMIIVGMFVGMAVMPYVILITPAAWPAILFDVWILSNFYILMEAISDAIRGRSFWASYATRMWPGLVWSLEERRRKSAREELDAAKLEMGFA